MDLDIDPTKHMSARSPPTRPEHIREDGVVDEVHEIPGLLDLEPQHPAARASVWHERARYPGKTPDFAAAPGEGELQSPAQVDLSQPRFLCNRQPVVVDKGAVLRPRAGLADVDADDHFRPRCDHDAVVDSNRGRVEVAVLQRQMVRDELIPVAARPRKHPAAADAYRPVWTPEEKVRRRTLGLLRRLILILIVSRGCLRAGGRQRQDEHRQEDDTHRLAPQDHARTKSTRGPLPKGKERATEKTHKQA